MNPDFLNDFQHFMLSLKKKEYVFLHDNNNFKYVNQNEPPYFLDRFDCFLFSTEYQGIQSFWHEKKLVEIHYSKNEITEPVYEHFVEFLISQLKGEESSYVFKFFSHLFHQDSFFKDLLALQPTPHDYARLYTVLARTQSDTFYYWVKEAPSREHALCVMSEGERYPMQPALVSMTWHHLDTLFTHLAIQNREFEAIFTNYFQHSDFPFIDYLNETEGMTNGISNKSLFQLAAHHMDKPGPFCEKICGQTPDFEERFDVRSSASLVINCWTLLGGKIQSVSNAKWVIEQFESMIQPHLPELGITTLQRDNDSESDKVRLWIESVNQTFPDTATIQRIFNHMLLKFQNQEDSNAELKQILSDTVFYERVAKKTPEKENPGRRSKI